METRTSLIAAACMLLLCACGGGGDSESDGPSTGGQQTQSFTVSVNVSGSGTVTSSPQGINCGSACSATFVAGTSITLTATPASGASFVGWQGSGVSCSGTSCSISVSSARTITAQFQGGSSSGPTVALNVQVSGSGGVSSNPGGLSCTSNCSAQFATNSTVTLVATAAAGNMFSGWSGVGISCGMSTSCPVEMTGERNVNATFAAQSTSTTDLCDGLVQDKAAHPMTALAKPAKGQFVIDPEFQTKIRRITDVQGDYGTSGVIKPAYSTIPAWNADESYLILYHTQFSGAGHYLYNGRTYERIRRLDISPPDLEQFYWDTDDPDLLYYVQNNPSPRRLIRYHISTGAKDNVHEFTACTGTVSGGGDPMFMAWNNDLIGLQCGGDIFAYRISTNQESVHSAGSSAAPAAAPSGSVLWYPQSSGARVLDPSNLQQIRALTLEPFEHGVLSQLANGNDVFASVQFDGSATGTLVTENLQTGEVRVIIGESTGYRYPPRSTHVSALAFKRPGWAAISIVGSLNGSQALDQELVLADMNPGGKVCRIGHHRSWAGLGNPVGQDYWAEPHVVISPSGTRVLFGSDWGGGASVDSYVVELPSYTP